MEYIDGMSLKAYVAIQGGKIPYDQALTILMPVMQALTQVHALNLTHRDISPGQHLHYLQGGRASCWISARPGFLSEMKKACRSS